MNKAFVASHTCTFCNSFELILSTILQHSEIDFTLVTIFNVLFMKKKSAGILVYRFNNQNKVEVLLVHPGGPFWKGKETGAWSIPKGEFADEEDSIAAARREFMEETGQEVEGEFLPLSPIKQKAGKMVYAWAVETEIDADNIVSNSFKMEYPYKSGKWINVPEVDKAQWFAVEEAREKINPAQAAFLEELVSMVE